MSTIHGTSSLLQLIIISLAMWYTVALACQQATAAYGVEILRIPISKVFVLMGSRMVGSLIQLPGVGGGSQLATISTLEHVFDVSPELAASCGILLWLVSFVSVIPFGLLLAHKERLFLWRLSAESQEEETSNSRPRLAGVVDLTGSDDGLQTS
jgi:hypothetical protein